MRGNLLRSFTAAAFGLCLVAGAAAAQGKGHDKGHDEKGKHDERANGDVNYPVTNRVIDPRVVMRNDEGAYRRVPPGLAKKGGLPPGQARKLYRASDGVVAVRDVFGRHGYTVVRTQPYGTSQYVYYRQGNGTLQRAIIAPNNGQLSFNNVPQTLLQEILARLR